MKKFALLLVYLCFALSMMATELVIIPYSGNEMQEDIGIIGKLVFVDNTMQLLDKSGNLLASESVTNIRRITFRDSVSDALENIVPAEIRVYPNPTQDRLIISGVEEEMLRVYDLQGRQVLQAEGHEVYVGNLSNGVYLLQIGTQVVRFIKQ